MKTATLASSRIPVSLCPECGYKMDGTAAAAAEHLMPQAGDVSVCLNCGQLLLFEEAMTMRKPTREEVAELIRHRENWGTIERVQLYIVKRGKIR